MSIPARGNLSKSHQLSAVAHAGVTVFNSSPAPQGLTVTFSFTDMEVTTVEAGMVVTAV